MIIVEGGDNTGKSTLVRRLIELDPGLRLLKRDKFHPSRGETIGTSYLDMLKPANGDFAQHLNSIADRCLASECIYGSLYRGGCRMTDAEHLQVEAMLLRFNALVIFCDPPDEMIMKDWTSRSQLYERDPLEIANTYRAQIGEIFDGLYIIRYDWTQDERWNIDGIIWKHQQLLRKVRPHVSHHQEGTS